MSKTKNDIPAIEVGKPIRIEADTKQEVIDQIAELCKQAEGLTREGGFVEYEDGWIFEYGAGYAESLPLSSAEFHAAVADIGLVGLFHAVDKFVGVGYDSGLFYMVEAVVGSAKGDVVGNGIVEEDGLLRHHAHQVA